MEGNGFADREKLLAAQPRRYDEVNVAGIGKVRIRSLRAGEAAELQDWIRTEDEDGQAIVDQDRVRQIAAKQLQLQIVDEHDEPLLTEDDIPQLMEQDAGVFAQLHRACEAITELINVDDAEKN